MNVLKKGSLIFCLLTLPAHASEVVSCPEPFLDVYVEGGPLFLIDKASGFSKRNGLEPDVGSDYDESAPNYEWNYLNRDKSTTPVILYCKQTTGSETTNIVLSQDITRCIQPKGGNIVCKTGTFSYSHYTERVQIEDISDEHVLQIVEPRKDGVNNKSGLLWQGLEASHKYRAICFDKDASVYSEGKGHPFDIPPDMKECSLKDYRFRCTATPDKHDLFWP